jgi:hypothetical protein
MAAITVIAVIRKTNPISTDLWDQCHQCHQW